MKERVRIINLYNSLIKIRGNNATSFKHVIDKNVFLAKGILSIKFGLIIYLIITLIKRRYKFTIQNNTFLNYRKSFFNVKVTPDYLLKSDKISILFLIKRTFFALRITNIVKEYINNNIIDKYLSVEFIWYLSCLYTDSIKFNSSELLLNGEVSAQELAILAFVDKNIKINFLMPLYWRFEDQYYYDLAIYSNSFIAHHPYDIPYFLGNNYELNIIKYKPKKIVFKKNKPCIGLFLTTFKNYEQKRFKIVSRTIQDIYEKYGKNIDLILKPHPFEYESFKNNKDLKKFNVQIVDDNKMFAKIDFCFVPQTTAIFEIVLNGIPIIMLRQIDVYYLFDFVKDNFFEDELIPKFDDIQSCPSYSEIINFYKYKNKFSKIQKILIGY